MLFWIAAAVMTGAVIVAIVWPLRTGAEALDAAPTDRDADVNVYKDQLRELNADLERGAISEADAGAAKIEISRRLLASADANATATSALADVARPVALACAVVVPLLALGSYLSFGQPGYSDLPRSARLQQPIERTPVHELIARVEARLREVPQDGQGWDVIAPIYLRRGQLDKAKLAFERAIAILGENDRRLNGLAQTIVSLNRGRVTDEAAALYEKLVQRLPQSPAPKFWLAVAKEQRGNLIAARGAYQKLLATAPDDAPWRATVQRRLDALSKRLSAAPLRSQPETAAPDAPSSASTPSAPPGPTQSDVAAASKMSPGDRMTMIQGMVDGLAERLAEDGSDAEGWKRLIRAYVVLGQRDKAEAALKRARVALADVKSKRDDVDAFAQRLGLPSSAEAAPGDNQTSN
ncbi:MAG: c-type cytochrome biogenesis protein CcmI [Pseudomonadota bacterium]